MYLSLSEKSLIALSSFWSIGGVGLEGPWRRCKHSHPFFMGPGPITPSSVPSKTLSLANDIGRISLPVSPHEGWNGRLERIAWIEKLATAEDS